MPRKDMLRLRAKGALTLPGASLCVRGGALRLQRVSYMAQASHGFERKALTLTARVHYSSIRNAYSA